MYREQVQQWIRLGITVKRLLELVDSKFQNDSINWDHYRNKISDISNKRLVKITYNVGFIDCAKDLDAAERELTNVENALAI